MKTLTVLSILLVAVLAAGPAFATDDPLAELQHRMEEARTSVVTAEDVAAISDALSQALTSDHRGLESAALRLVIAYGGVIELNRAAVIEMVRLYRDHKDSRVRQMAVVAIAATGDNWGIDFLERSEAYEADPAVLRTLKASLAAQRAEVVAESAAAERPLWARGTPVQA
ncbi:MAG: hypothetical protein JJ896_12745 [Rhodothermales bacterium]|nr:hypothetical protein [Rhodothermales bacterium]MBO6780515.1 hypothetical protein [Rhodothermales bacterium]